MVIFCFESSLEWVDSKFVEVFHSHIELNFHKSSWSNPCHISTLVFRQKFGWRDVLSRRTLEHTEERGKSRTCKWAEYMNVAGMRAWLGRNVCHSIAADDISAPEVTLRECENNLRPARDTVGSERNFKGKVPDHASVCLLALVGMLRYTTLITLYSNVELDILLLCLCVDLPRLLSIHS